MTRDSAIRWRKASECVAARKPRVTEAVCASGITRNPSDRTARNATWGAKAGFLEVPTNDMAVVV